MAERNNRCNTTEHYHGCALIPKPGFFDKVKFGLESQTETFNNPLCGPSVFVWVVLSHKKQKWSRVRSLLTETCADVSQLARRVVYVATADRGSPQAANVTSLTFILRKSIVDEVTHRSIELAFMDDSLVLSNSFSALLLQMKEVLCFIWWQSHPLALNSLRNNFNHGALSVQSIAAQYYAEWNCNISLNKRMCLKTPIVSNFAITFVVLFIHKHHSYFKRIRCDLRCSWWVWLEVSPQERALCPPCWRSSAAPSSTLMSWPGKVGECVFAAIIIIIFF